MVRIFARIIVTVVKYIGQIECKNVLSEGLPRLKMPDKTSEFLGEDPISDSFR